MLDDVTAATDATEGTAGGSDATAGCSVRYFAGAATNLLRQPAEQK